MCKSKNCRHRNPLTCIIPPTMLKRLEKSNDKQLSALAKLTKQHDIALRKARAEFVKSVRPQTSKNFAGKKIHPIVSTCNREVYDAKNGFTLPGKIIRKEGQPPTTDMDVNNVYDGAGHTWNFYHSLFSRNSIDNLGMKIIQSVHYGKQYQNAFWDGTQMVYGDGDGIVFGSFTNDIDIIAHELTHGVIQYECNLDYAYQSGALNESFADVFGIMIKQKALNQTAKKSNWLIGENVVIGKKYAIRSMKVPGTAYVNHPQLGTDDQVADMNMYLKVPLSQDNGGVHSNSGIPNHAFYLTAYNLGGYSWNKAGRIWYAAMQKLSNTAQFIDAKNVTIQEAELIFGVGSKEAKTVQNAWNAVNV